MTAKIPAHLARLHVRLHQEKVAAAKDAILKVYLDVDVTPSQIQESLESLKDDIEILTGMLKPDNDATFPK